MHMDSKSTSPDAPNLLAAMFQNASIDKAERSEFSNSARDFVNNYFNFTKEGENLVLESSDAIEFFRNVVQPFLAEVRKNDQSRSTPGGSASADGSDLVTQSVTIDHTLEGGPANISDLVPSELSSLPVFNDADRYVRSMLKCLAGYPLFEPQPFSDLSTEYLRNGVNVGDVGFIGGAGGFDFLFNVCASNDSLINPPNLPDGFILETEYHAATKSHLPKTCHLQGLITRTKSGEYICDGSNGAILELPDGTIQDVATNIRPFAKLAARHGVQWYEFIMKRGREISNGSLYLITSVARCAQWGIAVLDRPCAPGEGLRFDKKRTFPFGKSSPKYHWKGSRLFTTKVSNLNQGDPPNQCVFLRGYKIMVRQDVFDKLYNDQLRGSDLAMHSSPSPSTHTGDIKATSTPITNVNFSLVHPSDFINAALLSQNPCAKVALTHDNVWRDLLREDFQNLKSETLINIARSYTTTIDEYGCVTLDRISEVGNIVEDSHCPFEGKEILNFQESVTTSVDDYTHISGANSVTFPNEIVERILLFLDICSMLNCRLANRAFNEIIQTSPLLQYILACKAAGVINNPRSSLSYAERLEALKICEDAWRKLEPVFEITINVNRPKTSIVRPMGGGLFVDNNNQKDLNYCRLPSSPQENLHWARIPGHGPTFDWSGILVNFATAIDEHDLIVNFISSETANQVNMEQYSLDLVLLKFSTGAYHPLACQPRIHVQKSTRIDRASVMCKIVGDNLALIVRNDDEFRSKLVIFDWKTGYKRLQHESTERGTYESLIFVSPEFLLVPNCNLFHFEVWHIPHQQPNPNPPIQILCLQMPTVSPGCSVFGFRCYGEPSPFLHSAPYFPPQRPFYSAPENSVIMVPLRMTSGTSFNFIMRKCALLDTIQKWMLPSLLEQREDQPTWLTNEVSVLKITENGSGRLCAESKPVSRSPHSGNPAPPRNCDSPTFATCQTLSSVDFGSSSVTPGLYRCAFLQVPWAEWGPPISRWFVVSVNQARFLKLSNGQRYAFSEPVPGDGKKVTVSVADFNPHNDRVETMAQRRGAGEHKSSDGNHEEEEAEEGDEEEEWEILDDGGAFVDEVYMGLKCAIYRAPGEYDFDLVLMDEERLIGVKLNLWGWEESIKVLYIG